MPSSDCPRETTQQSKLSPSIVADSEYVLRAVYRTDHIDSDNNLTTTNIPLQQIIEPKGDGYSVNRESLFTFEIASKLANEFEEKNSKNEFQGFCKASVKSIRALRKDNEGTQIRTFCVLDDGLENNEAHALITPSKTLRVSDAEKKVSNAEKNRLRAIRFHLINTFNEFIKLEDLAV